MKFQKITYLSNAFCSARTFDDLCYLLKTEPLKLLAMGENPSYHCYEIRKSGGGYRTIEDPESKLKFVLKRLQKYLQCVYYFLRTEAAYGFLICSDKEMIPRNIFSNARKHIGAQYLVKTDLKDFFHQINKDDIKRIFSKAPFNWDSDASGFLSKITTYNGRLPMGSPTSPILSNFQTIKLDHSLSRFASGKELIFTRFADDLSFSSKGKISINLLRNIKENIGAQGFKLNKEKTRLLGPDDEKIITGLAIGGKDVYLSAGFIRTLREEFKRYLSVVEGAYSFGKERSKWIKKYKRKIEGMIEFAITVDGNANSIGRKIERKLIEAERLPTSEVFSWRDFPYI